MYIIEVIEKKTREVVKRLETENERKAERVEMGLMMQTNLNEYWVRSRFEELPSD